MFPHPVPPTTLGGEDFYSRCTGEDAGVQRGGVTSPESHSRQRQSWDWNPVCDLVLLHLSLPPGQTISVNKNDDNSFDSLNLLSSIYIPGTTLRTLQASFHLLTCPWEGLGAGKGSSGEVGTCGERDAELGR